MYYFSLFSSFCSYFMRREKYLFFLNLYCTKSVLCDFPMTVIDSFYPDPGPNKTFFLLLCLIFNLISSEFFLLISYVDLPFIQNIMQYLSLMEYIEYNFISLLPGFPVSFSRPRSVVFSPPPSSANWGPSRPPRSGTSCGE